ncbi:hypothetical protein B0O80DRAFT_144809 [Mortierella sp. GBAus27b]|nr:hypothetical protein B0O80DRAFT_144809 [Mortierella sp. GBAus27b]
MDSDPAEEQRRRVEHESIIRQRRLVPKTEDDLLAMQEEFFKANDRPAAAVVRVQPPTVTKSTATKPTVVEDGNDYDDDDDMPPPLERDVVKLDQDELPTRPPTVLPSNSTLRDGSRFLQDRASKGPRTHFPTPVGERFNIDFDDDNDGTARTMSHDEDAVETEEETRRRLNRAGPSMSQVLHEVLEKPYGDVVAPMAATTTLGSLTPTAPPNKSGFKGRSLFAKRLAEAQGSGSNNSKSAEATTTLTNSINQEIPASVVHPSITPKATTPANTKADVVTIPSSDDAVAIKPKVRPSIRKANDNMDQGLPPKPVHTLHSVLKKTPDSPHSTLMEQIDEENKRKLSSMSPEEIEQERAELLKNLDPELIRRLMKRNSVERRVSFSEGIKVENTVMNIHDVKNRHSDSSFQAKRHEEEADHPLALKKKFFADVPSEPEKLEWMGVEDTGDGVHPTPGKSVAPGPQPYTVTEADPPAAHYRFDFTGAIINDEETPIHLGLHHHGVDPTKAGYTLSELLHLIRSTVPSQRILPLNVVAKVLQNCRSPTFATFEVRSGILRWLIDTLRAPVYIRAALDDKTDSGVVAAVNALNAWIMPQSNLGQSEDVWESLDHLDRGYERISLGFKYQTTTRFANMELKPDTLQSSQEQGTEDEETIASHAILASKEPVDGLLAMNIMPRLSPTRG